MLKVAHVSSKTRLKKGISEESDSPAGTVSILDALGRSGGDWGGGGQNGEGEDSGVGLHFGKRRLEVLEAEDGKKLLVVGLEVS